MTMRTPVTQEAILAGIVKNVQEVPDHSITSITWGVCLSAVQSQKTGLASLVSHIAPKTGTVRPADGPGQSAHQTAAALLDPKSTNTDHDGVLLALSRGPLRYGIPGYHRVGKQAPGKLPPGSKTGWPGPCRSSRWKGSGR